MHKLLVGSAVLMLAGTVWYMALVIRNKIQPVLATWIILSVTMTLAWISYWRSPVHSWTGNIGGLTGFASTSLIFLTVFITQVRGGLKVKFNKVQVWCLAGAGVIMIIWWVLRFAVGGPKAATGANVLTQILMIVGFVPMVVKLWSVKETSESLFTWSMIFAACYLAIITSDGLGTLYAIRGAECAGITAYMIARIRLRS